MNDDKKPDPDEEQDSIDSKPDEVQDPKPETGMLNQEPPSDTPPADQTQPQVENAPIAPPPTPSFWKKLTTNKWFIASLLVIVTAGLVSAGFLLFSGDSEPVVEEQPTSEEKLTDVDPNYQITEDDLKHLDIPDEQETVSSSLEEIAYLEFFSEEGINEYYTDRWGTDQENLKNNITWYKLGTVDGADILLASASSEGLFTTYDKVIFSRDASGKVKLLTNHSSDNYPAVIDGIELDPTTSLTAFEVPEEITIDGAILKNISGWKIPGIEFGLGFDRDLEGYTKLADTEYGVMYEKIEDGGDEDGVKSYKLILEMPFGTLAGYRFIVTPMLDDNSMAISFNDGSSTNYMYRWDTVERGCGSSHQVNVLAKQYHADLTEIGTASGHKVYGLPDANHPVIEEFYTTYSVGRDESTLTSKQEYFDGKNLVILKNELNYYVVLANQEFQSNAECAKPVIYVYPEQTMAISVKVGANVTQSIPDYGNGWNAIAFPSGSLLTSEGFFDSLFWDGIGYGNYPEIVSGNFVARADVESTITANLDRMGLNDQETADFLEYWMPLMPDTEYVRLTWLTTAEMNQLAPLELSFVPDSMIRVFLDFEGVDQPYELPSQEVPSYQRYGTSLIEWGGLKIGN